ncbi:hypothetical protein MKEN_01175200 [Mycena kentingensis (nom. inval.)]|nr:hypothetical protein MKEN_01175200 [Mycena kentingensis (nom. inval.)]
MDSKRKRPPSFAHHPANRAKKLKSQWVNSQKIKSKWKADKRKHMQEVETEEVDEVEDMPVPPMQPNSPPSASKATKQSEPPRHQQHPRSLRDRAREAYSRSSLHTYKSEPSGKRQRGGTTGRGQPNMKLRMGVLLETIKRDYR